MKNAVPLEYWETCDSRQGGVIVDINQNGLWVRSLVSMHVGAELRIAIFFSLGNEFDSFQVLARTVGKDLSCEEGWEAYGYKLEFVAISAEGRLKLTNLLRIRQAKDMYS